MKTHQIIGIDLDNTIIQYDDLWMSLAKERGLIDKSVNGKTAIRDKIRLLPNGEIEWQRLQALVYGERITDAKPMEGVENFINACRDRRIPVFIISHKTRFSNLGETKVDLRESARNWLASFNYFGLDPQQDIFFESTREEKAKRVATVECTDFIDDLVETFLDPAFPQKVNKILFGGGQPKPVPRGVVPMNTWKEIHGHFFPKK